MSTQRVYLPDGTWTEVPDDIELDPEWGVIEYNYLTPEEEQEIYGEDDDDAV